MESANLHHQHQIQSPSSSSSLSSPPFSTSANWTQSFTLNNSNPRQKQEIPNQNFSNLMIQELGFHHTNQFTPAHFDRQNTGKIKEELSPADQIFPKFTEMLTSSNINGGDSIEQKYMNDILSEKLLLKTISSGFPINSGDQFSASNFYGRGSFSQIYPSINVSGLNRTPVTAPPLTSPGNFDMNLEALDLLASTRFSGSFEPSFNDDNLGLYKDNKFMQHSSQFPSCNPSKIPTSSVFTANEITEAKRPIEPKATQAAPKKSRVDSRASCPPLKVRKEKLGDRIAALQQLVAPFGKTDTASVLMEAIGYIKFLQNQVETLSVPYMKSSRNKSSRTTTHGFQGSTMEETNDETKRDLRSRGLCLVPLSCMSYVTGDGSGGGIWPPPNFGGGT